MCESTTTTTTTDISNINLARTRKDLGRPTGHINGGTPLLKPKMIQNRDNIFVGHNQRKTTDHHTHVTRKCLCCELQRSLSGVLAVFQDVICKLQRKVSNVLLISPSLYSKVTTLPPHRSCRESFSAIAKLHTDKLCETTNEHTYQL